MIWRVWFSDGSSHEGRTQEDWEALPDKGVLFVFAYHGRDEHGRPLTTTLGNVDWYWMHEGTLWAGSDSSPVKGEWLENTAPRGAISKAGEWVDDETYLAAREEMLKHGHHILSIEH